MPSFRRRESVIDADPVEEPPVEPDHANDAGQALALAEEAEAEAAEAEAMAAAARARARAIRLRREAQLATEVDEKATEVESKAVDATSQATELDEPVADETVADELDESAADEIVAEADDAAPEPVKSRRLRRPSWKRVLVATAGTLVVLLTAGLLAASGYMIWSHREAEKVAQQNAEYAAAGRQSVVTLMSLDYNKAEEGVQRIIDNSTGQFRDDFQQQAADFVKVAQDSKVITEVTVNSVAVDSMTDDTAVVLVAASSRVTNTAGAKQEPRTWRLSVDLQREGDQIKMSKVEFVP